MLLALYANGVLRLWNMLDARCIFKKKVGMSAESSGSEDEEDQAENDDDEFVEEEKEDKAYMKKLQSEAARRVLKQMDKSNLRAEQVMWEPTEGNLFAVLFSRVMEVYSVEEEEPIHAITFDTT